MTPYQRFQALNDLQQETLVARLLHYAEEEFATIVLAPELLLFLMTNAPALADDIAAAMTREDYMPLIEHAWDQMMEAR